MGSLLTLLLVSQVSFAAHQFEHSAAELHEVCAVCLQFERDDDLVFRADVEALLPTALSSVTVQTRIPVCAQGFAHYRSRASP